MSGRTPPAAKGSKLQRLGIAFVLVALVSVSPQWYGANYSLLGPFGVLVVFVGLFLPDDSAEEWRPSDLFDDPADAGTGTTENGTDTENGGTEGGNPQSQESSTDFEPSSVPPSPTVSARRRPPR